MEAKVVFMLLVLLPLLCQARIPKERKPKDPFGFMEHLKGCHKGENVKGLHELKQYLKKFGYLDGYHQSNNVTHDDDFDDLVESAIRTYQLNYNLNTTGTLDFETVKTMMAPRCAVPDIINGKNSMRSGKEHHHGTLHTTSHYQFFPGSPTPRWTKSHLTYAFLPNTQVEKFSPPCGRAFARWASVSHFTFQEISDVNAADITIGVFRRDHGDGYPFDGRGGTIAHAFQPENGRFHFDGDEPFAVGVVPNAYDLETIALHEIGHLLGLFHSDVEDAIMFPTIHEGVRKDLNGDDVAGIRALYNR